MILLIDNYDSFTYNLYQLLAQFDAVMVRRNDEITLDDIECLAPQRIVISPGPGKPSAAGISIAVVRYCVDKKIPLLGVCLGHQAIVEALGGEIRKAELPVHGKAAAIFHHGKALYQGLPTPFNAGRYHSLYAVRESLPDCLIIDAENKEGMIMGVSHKTARIYGVQFHPESFLTPEGSMLIQNFCESEVFISPSSSQYSPGNSSSPPSSSAYSPGIQCCSALLSPPGPAAAVPGGESKAEILKSNKTTGNL